MRAARDAEQNADGDGHRGRGCAAERWCADMGVDTSRAGDAWEMGRPCRRFREGAASAGHVGAVGRTGGGLDARSDVGGLSGEWRVVRVIVQRRWVATYGALSSWRRRGQGSENGKGRTAAFKNLGALGDVERCHEHALLISRG